MVGHRTFSDHFFHLSEQSQDWTDIVSERFTERYLVMVVSRVACAYHVLVLELSRLGNDHQRTARAKFLYSCVHVLNCLS